MSRFKDPKKKPSKRERAFIRKNTKIPSAPRPGTSDKHVPQKLDFPKNRSVKAEDLSADLLALLKYDPDTGIITSDVIEVSYKRHPEGYFRMFMFSQEFFAHRLAAVLSGLDIRDKNVHHINNDRTDNRLCNLEVMTHADHTREHKKNRLQPDCSFNRKGRRRGAYSAKITKARSHKHQIKLFKN